MLPHRWLREHPTREVPGFVIAQLVGGAVAIGASGPSTPA